MASTPSAEAWRRSDPPESTTEARGIGLGLCKTETLADTNGSVDLALDQILLGQQTFIWVRKDHLHGRCQKTR